MPGIPNPDARGSSTGGQAWTAAPAGSHLWGWKYYDIRLYPEIGGGRLGPVSVLQVAFRLKDGSKGAEYVYGFPDPDDGQRVYDALVASAHPFGGVLKPRVMDAGYSYSKV